MARGVISTKFTMNRIPDLLRQLPGDVDDMNREMAYLTLEVGNERVPVATGALQETGSVERVPGGYAATWGDPASGVDYALPVHFGHVTASGSFVAGRPWATEAASIVERQRERYYAALGRKIEGA